jgi:hypothetical protein
LRIFRCVAYAHLTEEMRKNLDDRSEKCVFVGYNEDSKEYIYSIIKSPRSMLSTNMLSSKKKRPGMVALIKLF